MANSYLNKTFSGAPTNAKKGTVSIWFKLAQNDSSSNNYYRLFVTGADANNRTDLNIVKPDADVDSNDKAGRLLFSHLVGGNNYTWRTNRQLRDMSAYYHLVVAYDTTQASASDRLKIYINGEQETSLDNSATIPQDTDLFFGNNSSAHHIGNSPHYSPRFFQGYMSHFAYVDGTALTPTSFGETDSTSGIWKFKSPSSVTWGNNGVHLKFENSGNMGLDSSGNTHNFTVNGNLKQSLDTPSNNHSTINGLFRSRFLNQATLTNGNLTMTTGPTDGDKALLLGTQGVTKGKWYWECKVGADRSMIGFAYDSISRFSDFYGSNSPSDGFSVYGNNGNVYYDGTNTAYGSSWTTNDIIMVALDMDNKLAWLGKNGTWMNSATQTEIENGTATNDLTTKMSTKQNLNSGEPVFPLFADMTGTGDMAMDINFGSGFFGTTAISSAGSNGNGSLFEYNVPSGYYALNTKNINTYG